MNYNTANSSQQEMLMDDEGEIMLSNHLLHELLKSKNDVAFQNILEMFKS